MRNISQDASVETALAFAYKIPPFKLQAKSRMARERGGKAHSKRKEGSESEGRRE